MKRAGLAFGLLLVVSVLFRLPPLLNARGLDSDAAIVGLQAMHIARGEWSWFLWAREHVREDGVPRREGYQSSFDAAVVALVFLVTGPSALALMATPLLGHLLLTFFAWDVLRRRLGPWRGVALCLPLAFATQPLNGVALYAPRQWALTALVAAVWALDRSADAARSFRWLSLGGFLGVAALYLDLYVLQAMPALALYAMLTLATRGGDRRQLVRAAGSLALGAVAMGVAFWWSRRGGDVGKASITLERIGPNAQLLWNTALPFLLGYDVYIPGARLYPELWDAPAAWRIFSRVGAASFGLAIFAAVPLAFVPSLPRAVRNLGLFGAGVSATALVGFVLSVMPQDLWSARYLAVIVWTAPFALAPAFFRLNARGYALLTPYVLTTVVAGWLNFGPYVDGPLPTRSARGVAHDEAAVGEELRRRGVHHAAAQYWLAYRLTFLWREDPIVVPLARWEDRYRPYLEAVAAAPKIAYIFHPSEPRAHPSQIEPVLRAQGARYERVELRGFTLLIHHRD